MIRTRRGQSTVELALCLPVLMMLLCGIIEMGFLFYNTLRLHDGVREGARQGARGGLDCRALTDLVKTYRPVLGMNGLTIRVTIVNQTNGVVGVYDNYAVVSGSPEDRTVGNRIEVRATCAVDWLTPLSALLKLVPVPVRVDSVCLISGNI